MNITRAISSPIPYEYNRIVIVGNGFDLSLGLQTSYKNFILHLIKNYFLVSLEEGSFSNEFINISYRKNSISNYKIFYDEFKNLNSLEQVFKVFQKLDRSQTSYNNAFFEAIVTNFRNNNWVDIEYFYFSWIKKAYLNNESRGLENHFMNRVVDANNVMEFMGKELKAYLNSIEINITEFLDHKDLINKLTLPFIQNEFEFVHSSSEVHKPKSILFLNFNYTSSIGKFIYGKDDCLEIQIHGSIDKKENLIFGYGNDTDQDYRMFENRPENGYRELIKTFYYPQTDNYTNLLKFTESGIPYEIIILGHSCGVSDKTLLSTLFEREECLAIKNYHYSGIQEDFYKHLEIARHFQDKVLMRRKVLKFDPEAKIPQINS